MEDEVGQKVKCWSNIVVQNLDIEADGFFPGEGVEIASDGVGFAGELVGGARGGAFEDHVLDEVGDAVEGEGFVAGAGVDPDAHGYGADVGDGLGEDQEAVGQAGAADVACGGCGGTGGGGEGCGHAAPDLREGRLLLCHRG